MNINLFEEVKRLIDIKSVVLYYGLKLNSNNMAWKIKRLVLK